MLDNLNTPTELVQYVDRETEDRYLRPTFWWLLNMNIKKGGKRMVDIEKIKSDIANLELLTAEEYCKDDVARIYADFEANRERKVAELKTSLEIFERYQIVEETEEAEEVEAE